MALEGKLTDMPLTDLLYIFQRGARAGSLVLWNAAELATVWFRQGQPFHALVLSQGDRRLLHKGEGALLALSAWADGQFLYKPDSRTDGQPATIDKPSTVLIAQMNHQRGGAPPRPLPPELTPLTALRLLPEFYGGRAAVELSVEDWTVLTRIKPGTTVEELALMGEMTVERTLHVVAHLITLGLVCTVQLANLPPRRLTVAPPAGLMARQVGEAPVSNLTRAIRRRLQQMASAS